MTIFFIIVIAVVAFFIFSIVKIIQANTPEKSKKATRLLVSSTITIAVGVFIGIIILLMIGIETCG